MTSKSYTRNYNNLRYNISQGLGKALPNKIPRNGGGLPKFGPAVESCSLLFSIIFFHILDFAVTSWYNTTSPKTKRNAARVGSTIGKGGMLWQSILYKSIIIIPYFTKKIKGVSYFFREIFDFLLTTPYSRGIVELYMRGCAAVSCRVLFFLWR